MMSNQAKKDHPHRGSLSKRKWSQDLERYFEPKRSKYDTPEKDYGPNVKGYISGD